MNRIVAIVLIGIIIFLTIKLCMICGENRTLELDNENLQDQVYEIIDTVKQRNDYGIAVG